eukprot:UN11287
MVTYVILLFLGDRIEDDFVICFIVVILLVAFDFWTVKNVSGRLLVGLRWWNEIKEDGTSAWIFESLAAEDKYKINQLETLIFWVSLFGAPVVWLVFLIIAFIPPQPDNLVIVTLSLVLSCVNIVGYVRCARDQRKQLTTFAQKYATTALVNQGLKQATEDVNQRF